MAEIQAHSETRVRLFVLRARIAQSIDDRDYLETYSIFLVAQEVYDAYHNDNGPKPVRGSVESNMIEHAFTDIVSTTADAMNRRVSDRRSVSITGCEGPRQLTREVGAEDLTLALMLAHKSLAYPGISDTQRFIGHYHRAIAHSNMGDFMTELDTIVPESEHAAMLANTVEDCRDPLWCYENAAQDAFFAARVVRVAGVDGLPQELVNDVPILHPNMCAKLGINAHGHFIQMHRDGLARHQLPVLGPWEGDPALAAHWGHLNMTLMALFRQTDDSNGLTAEELEEEFAEQGIHWTHDERGEIVLVDTP